jgi:hypothetical protein
MQIHAIKDEPIFNISAAKASPNFRGVEHLLRRANIDIMKQLTVRELDMKLEACAALTIGDRIAVKSTLSRVGILI